MKRDIEIIRQLLDIFEAHNSISPIEGYKLKIENVEVDTITYHVRILEEAGFIDASFDTPDTNGIYYVNRVNHITWEGHEFFDSLKNKELWNQFVGYLKGESKELGTMPLKTMMELFKLFVKNIFEKKLGLK